jgi:hypothetical protein
MPGRGTNRGRDQPVHAGETIDEERDGARKRIVLRLEPRRIDRRLIDPARAEAQEGMHLVDVAADVVGIVVELRHRGISGARD